MFQVIASGLDSFVAQPTAVHGVYFDVEAQSDGSHALIVRSKDKFVRGVTKTPEKAELRFNGSDGSHTPIYVATNDKPETLTQCAAELITFYTSEASFSDRYNALSEPSRAVLSVVAGVFGAQRLNRNGWKVGSLKSISDAESAKQAKDAVESLKKLQSAAASLKNSDALKSAMTAQGIDASGFSADALNAAVTALLAGIGLGGAAPTAPVSE